MAIETKPFQDALLNWFWQMARQMPWRDNPEPYAVWISEIMLQQTQVETVRPYFARFMAAFPNIQALAEAPQDRVLKLWEGLGYYSRARNLHKGAQYLLHNHSGQLPQTREKILKVPGIGPYSAGAILSIAFQIPEPAIDGNVIRVISRLTAFSDPIEKATSQRNIETVVRSLISDAHPGDFNQALMELGALICKPRNPLCKTCPVQPFCSADKQSSPENYPVKTAKPQIKNINLAVALLSNQAGQFLLAKQEQTGIFKALWCFPQVEYSPSNGAEPALIQYFESQYQWAVKPLTMLTEIEHVLTHRRLKMQVYLCEPLAKETPRQMKNWISLDNYADYAIPVAHQKIIRFMKTHPLLLPLHQAKAL